MIKLVNDLSHHLCSELISAVRSFLGENIPQALQTCLLHVESSNAELKGQSNLLAGLCLLKMEDFAKAEKFISTALKSKSLTQREVWKSDLYLAICLAQLQKNSEAMESFNKSVDLQKQMGQSADPADNFYFIQAMADNGQEDAVWPAMESMAAIYKKAYSTEPATLNAKGLPDFTDFIRVLVRVGMKSTKANSLQNTLNDLNAGVDTEGKSIIKKFLF